MKKGGLQDPLFREILPMLIEREKEKHDFI